ncbi:phosphatase PAP2 family protein [Microbulbifer thermotolerans]|nr:phosphatase PAP2 family protein [Microbulbifer thermotolerans]MCX2778860.1 phosphatase PAP2 family protein [Microbulbifer thermotolerans]MCX2784330.1 phosphatase PAP2 family protein [Microbulbifer thermotolerans]MCX2793746.1 phosphatase PAP2 family protein [Microbulbifer thermotolerans]MCX2800929.1 phosphatase PAP2 family protein [Microbulbifer thermotolerans]MCX2804165.1 phosphatase PAP2 family protein [Microbulbifer thermotolerans]
MTLKHFDVSLVLHMAQRAARPASRKRYLWLSKSGDGWLYLLSPLIVALSSTTAAAIQYFFMCGTAFAVERSLYWTIKNTTKRLRPPQAIPGMRSVIVAHDRFSLPSGHTSGAFLFVTLLSQTLSPLWLLGYFWAAGVGTSRVGLGVHFPTDVCAGAALGTSVGLLISGAFL